MNAEAEPDKKEGKPETTTKKHYTAPQLTIHGNLEEITGLLVKPGKDLLAGGTFLI